MKTKTEKTFTKRFESSLSKCPVSFDEIIAKVDISKYETVTKSQRRWLKPLVISCSCVLATVLVTVVIVNSPLFMHFGAADSGSVNQTGSALTRADSSFAVSEPGSSSTNAIASSLNS